MKLWLDDVRRPPDETWVWARSVDQALECVVASSIEEMSLDHDLGGIPAENGGVYDYSAPTGLDFVEKWLAGRAVWPERITIHSNNAHGAMEMARTLWLRLYVQQPPATEIRLKPEWRTH